MLGLCDCVSLHVLLTDVTRHLMNEKTLALMKPTAYLINTARGPVVSEVALVYALENWKACGSGFGRVGE